MVDFRKVEMGGGKKLTREKQAFTRYSTKTQAQLLGSTNPFVLLYIQDH